MWRGAGCATIVVCCHPLLAPSGASLHPVPLPYTYVFVGLTPSERALLESLFALNAGEADALRPVSRPEDAHLIIVNGDDRTVVESLRQHHPHALLVRVGKPVGAAPDELPTLRRPLEMEAVAEVLSRLDWPEQPHGAETSDFYSPSLPPPASGPTMSPPESSPMTEPGQPRFDASSFAPTTAASPLSVPAAPPPTMPAATVSARATWAVSEHAPLQPPRPPAAPQGRHEQPFSDDTNADVMVVVGELGRRSHTLPRGIRRLGFRVRLVEGADAALAAYELQPLHFVFLDQTSLGDALLPLARTLTAQRPMPGQPPHVVVVARRGTAFDRLRANLAGCTWMAVPIDRERLLGFFAHRGLRPRH